MKILIPEENPVWLITIKLVFALSFLGLLALVGLAAIIKANGGMPSLFQ